MINLVNTYFSKIERERERERGGGERKRERERERQKEREKFFSSSEFISPAPEPLSFPFPLSNAEEPFVKMQIQSHARGSGDKKCMPDVTFSRRGGRKYPLELTLCPDFPPQEVETLVPEFVSRICPELEYLKLLSAIICVF